MPTQQINRLVFLVISLCLYSDITLAEIVKQEVYVETKMYGHSETAAIKQIVLDEFEGSDYAGGKGSFTHNVWESGVRFDGFKIAAIARYDYVLNYTTDVAELVYADKNDKKIETNRSYDLYLDIFHARTYGFKVGYSFSLLPSLIMDVDISALKVASFMDGSLNGNVLVGDDSYDGDIYLDYVYTKDKLLDRITAKPNGYGYALDLRWAFQANDRLNIDAKILDLFSQIKIDRAPFTTAKASSNRVNLDDNGQIDVKPVLTGREGFRKHTLRLPKQMSIEGGYRLDDFYIAGVRFDQYDQRTYTSLLLSIPFSDKQQFKSAYDFRTGAFTFDWQDQNWRCSITSDEIDITQARTFGLSFGLARQF